MVFSFLLAWYNPGFSLIAFIASSGNSVARLNNFLPLSTTKYSYAKDIAVNLEIAAFQWDAEDEPIDIDMIAFVIVRELSEVGK